MYGFASNYLEVEEKLGARESRKVGNNTYLHRIDNDHIGLRLHSTDVLTFDPWGITFNTGGWYTVTTRARMNDYAPGNVYQERGVMFYAEPGAWRIVDGKHERDRTRVYRYWDGLRVDYLGDVLNPESAPKDAEGERKAIERDITAYVRKVKDALPLPAPNGGDCWLCLMFEPSGQSDNGHLTSHMAEGYVVPSLVLNALRDAGYGNPEFVYQLFAMSDRPDPPTVGRAVRKYLRKRLVTVN
jgi:hypothetical protein